MGSPTQPSALKFYAYSAILGIIGFLSLLLITRHGIGVGVDSVTYIGGAKNLLNGKGFSAYTLSDNGINPPITRFPPLFSIVIAFTGYFNSNLIANTRMINSILFGANIILVGLILNKATYGSFWFSILGSFIILTSTSLLDVHSFAYSEPMSIFLSTLGLFLLCIYIESPKKIFLIISALIIAMALLTRYAAFPCIIAGIIGISLLSRTNYYKKLLDSLIYLLISTLPMAIWIVRNLYVSGDVTGRKFTYHIIGLKSFKAVFAVLSEWLLNSSHSSVYIKLLASLALIISIIILIYFIYNKDIIEFRDINGFARISYPIIPSLYFIYCVCYLLFIFFSKSFIDAYIPIDNRMLSALFAPLVIILVYSMYKIYSGPSLIVRYILCTFCILFAIFYLVQGSRWAVNIQKDGRGYSSLVWKKSETLNNLNGIISKIIYSNACDAIYIISGKSCYHIPFKYDPNSLEINKHYFSEISSLRKKIRNHKTILVWINKISWRKYIPSKKELIKELNLKLIRKYDDGAIYGTSEQNKLAIH